MRFHPFALIYTVVAVVTSGFLLLGTKCTSNTLEHVALGFVMFIPAGLFVLMNFRENRYPIYLFVKRPDWIRIKKRFPVFDKYLVGAMIFAVIADLLAKSYVTDYYAFYAGAILNMLWSVVDLLGKDAMERHPIIWRKK